MARSHTWTNMQYKLTNERQRYLNNTVSLRCCPTHHDSCCYLSAAPTKPTETTPNRYRRILVATTTIRVHCFCINLNVEFLDWSERFILVLSNYKLLVVFIL